MYASSPLVSWDDSKRSGFGNHAFIDVGGKIFDACAGLHLGTEDILGYLKNSIDGYQVGDPRYSKLYGVTPPGQPGLYPHGNLKNLTNGAIGIVEIQ